MKIDKRITKTKDKIKKALCKDYNTFQFKDTCMLYNYEIKELCRYAKVNRATFYNNYANVGEVVYDIFNDFIKWCKEHKNFSLNEITNYCRNNFEQVLLINYEVHVAWISKIENKQVKKTVIRALAFIRENVLCGLEVKTKVY